MNTSSFVLSPKQELARLYAGIRLQSSHRFLLWCGIILTVSGLVHGGILLLTGGSLEGPLSWRKPAVFGLSFGITAITIALLAPALRIRKRATWGIYGSLGVASILETALITMQTWRGVPSHFNFTTLSDTTVFIAMGVLVAIVAAALLILAVLSFTAVHSSLAPSFILALRTGMVLLIVAQILGALIITVGVEPAVTGNTDAVFGPEGVVIGDGGILKYPHGIALHAIQVLPVIAVLALMTTWPEKRRIVTVGAACLGYILHVTVSTFQAFSGRGLLTLSWFDIGILTIAALLLLGSGLSVLIGAIKRS